MDDRQGRTRRRLAGTVTVAILASFLVSGGSLGAGRALGTGGGTYRTALPDFGFTDAFDPTGEYLGIAWGLYSQTLLRTLVTYRHVAGERGAQVVPDLATTTGEVSADGLTYTFVLKDGLRFGPPVDRAVTSADVAYAFARIDAQSLVAQYGYYYDGVVLGMAPHPGPPTPIPGIQTPDDHTIVFHLTRPTGDFVDRLALPATSPIPSEVGECFTRYGEYGRDLVSTGPYMIEGAEGIDISSCDAIRPMPGFDPTSKLVLVRNPNYDPSTDDPSVRQNFIDGVDIRVLPDQHEIIRRIQAGRLDGSLDPTPPADEVRAYLKDPGLRPFLHADSGDKSWYITMNLLVPPFDDVHVRKAVNWVVDKATLQRAWGGGTHGGIATHALPPFVIGGLAHAYDPYQTPGFRGDLVKARAEIARSKYDANHDGICDAPVCRGVLFVNRSSPPQVNMTSVIVRDLSRIGIELRPKLLTVGGAYVAIQTVANLVPIAANAGWGKDYTDPNTFDGLLFHSRGISCVGQVNYAEVGMTESQATSCGVLAQWQQARPPSIDADIDTCGPLTGDDRLACWTDVEHRVMEDVVPWVPYLWGSNITIVGPTLATYVYDQFAGIISLCHLELEPA